MRDYYDAIYLSPHLDDIALSCGGQVYLQTAAGKGVLIVTFMAGDPAATAVSAFAQSLHERWQLLADAAAQRRREDREACQVLGADCDHGNIPDCIYRVNPETAEPFYTSPLAIFGVVDAADKALVDVLAAQMAALPPHGAVYAPLTVGHHVDHQLVRWAAERVFGEALRYYEDYPYARDEEAVEAVVRAGAVAEAKAAAWQFEVVPLTETAVARKIEAIEAYASQVSTFFNGREDLAAQIRAYTARVGGERVWRVAGEHLAQSGR